MAQPGGWCPCESPSTAGRTPARAPPPREPAAHLAPGAAGGRGVALGNLGQPRVDRPPVPLGGGRPAPLGPRRPAIGGTGGDGGGGCVPRRRSAGGGRSVGGGGSGLRRGGFGSGGSGFRRGG